ncbi:MAG: HEAT repeat domain-containing protein [Chloroflexota bacterium]|nr:HEAT repeat domain-containing protein [Chloroflexota bacterium]
MFNFFRNLRIERISFWIGFLAASLFWWLVPRLLPYLDRIWKGIKKLFQSTKQGLQANIEQRHRTDTLKHAQGLHLAAPLFSLDEIIISPRLLAPPILLAPEETHPTDNIVSQTIPYMPDCPQLASIYGAQTLSLEEALQGGLNIAIIGPAGSGKTVALAHLASRISRREVESKELRNLIPILIHAADLNLPIEEDESPINGLTDAVAVYTSTLSLPRLPNFLQTTFEGGQALLLLDGLDELAPEPLTETINYLQALLREYPRSHAVVAAAANHLDGLPKLGFIPIPMATWSPRQQAQFAKQWANMWSKHIDTEPQENYVHVDPLILNGWLLNRNPIPSPLEFSLQIWATYAGDIRGPNATDALEAYLRRMSVSIPKARAALQNFAAQAIISMRTSFTYKDAKKWGAEILPESIDNDWKTAADSDPEASSQPQDITVPRVLPDLTQSGLLIPRADNRLGFVHPLIASYLAGQILDDEIFSQPSWPLKDMTIHHIASHRDISKQANQLLSQSDKPLRRGTLTVSHWLPDIRLDAAWRKPILSKLANILQDESIPLGTRSRVLTGLAITNDPNISALFRHLMKSPKPSVRQLSALGSGVHRDTQAVNGLIQLLEDQPMINRAACLALVNIGTKPALEAVASTLLQGSEESRRAAAEAFANHPDEGYPTLKDGITMDDLLVRRAVIFGLRRVGEPWAIQLLGEVQIEDAQWVVKNAAAQAFEELHQPDPHIPQALPSLADTPWLIAFAGERGVGISPGQQAHEMLLRVLKEGNPEEQLAALAQLRRRGITKVFPAIYHPLYAANPETNAAALYTIWHLAASGAEIPPPMQFGLG